MYKQAYSDEADYTVRVCDCNNSSKIIIIMSIHATCNSVFIDAKEYSLPDWVIVMPQQWSTVFIQLLLSETPH